MDNLPVWSLYICVVTWVFSTVLCLGRWGAGICNMSYFKKVISKTTKNLMKCESFQKYQKRTFITKICFV